MSASAFLLFVVQPLIARLVLPVLGGSPSVWTTCMLFFQSALLAGYALAHLLGRRRYSTATALLHASALLLPLAVLPLGLRAAPAVGDGGHPVLWLLALLTASVGPPFVVLATTAPLLQGWFSQSTHRAAGDPYFLYASSNAGSVAALLSYPTLIEPTLPLAAQTRLWSAGYVLAAALILACVVLGRSRAARRQPSSPPGETAAAPPPIRRVEWLALAFVPSSLLLGVTTYLSTDLAVVPLLWIVPLLIYLAAFIVAFSAAAGAVEKIFRRIFPLVLLPLVMLLIARGGAALWFALPLHLLTFASISVLCLARLARARPHPAHLTRFYLWIAAGGMFAGIFNSLVAPAIFIDVAEYPLMIAAACVLLALPPLARHEWTSLRVLRRPLLVGLGTAALLFAARLLQLDAQVTMILLGPAALLCFSVSRQPARFAVGVTSMLAAGALVGTSAWGRVLHAERTFFGVYRVSEDSAGTLVTLYHGTTVHGRQRIGEERPEPLAYYHRGSPIADVLRATAREGRSVGVVGLGVGSLAAYARAGERWYFYEIDPAVERLARDARFFRFLSACPSCVVSIGDARLTLGRTDRQHDLLVIDAFSSDAIPMHLLTSEALITYTRRLTPNGLLAFHISNRHVALRPVLARLARDAGWLAVARFADGGTITNDGSDASDWAVLARDSRHLAGLESGAPWAALRADARPAWTDDFSNLWTALRWW